MRTAFRWGLAFVLADLLTGITCFSMILLGAVGLAFVTGMSEGLTTLFVGLPIEGFVGIAMTAVALLAVRGYRCILRMVRERPAIHGSGALQPG